MLIILNKYILICFNQQDEVSDILELNDDTLEQKLKLITRNYKIWVSLAQKLENGNRVTLTNHVIYKCL